jgi:hypothetical protein
MALVIQKNPSVVDGSLDTNTDAATAPAAVSGSPRRWP